MLFIRVDDNESNGRPRVAYTLQTDENPQPLQIVATFDGVKVVGETPVYTDLTELNATLTKAYYQYNRIHQTGKPISVSEEHNSHFYGIDF